MIVSIHIPKAGGTSFGQVLKAEFNDRLMLDYGDWAGFDSPDARTRRKERMTAARLRRDEIKDRYDVIHGHFHADKYFDLFESQALVSFVRDPFQQAISNYQYLSRNPGINHPMVAIFHEQHMSIEDYLDWASVANPQSMIIGKVPLESFAMVGITEQFDRSIALFNALFERKVLSIPTANVNPAYEGTAYALTSDLRKRIERTRELDIGLYRRAVELFAAQAASHGI